MVEAILLGLGFGLCNAQIVLPYTVTFTRALLAGECDKLNLIID